MPYKLHRYLERVHMMNFHSRGRIFTNLRACGTTSTIQEIRTIPYIYQGWQKNYSGTIDESAIH